MVTMGGIWHVGARLREMFAGEGGFDSLLPTKKTMSFDACFPRRLYSHFGFEFEFAL